MPLFVSDVTQLCLSPLEMLYESDPASIHQYRSEPEELCGSMLLDVVKHISQLFFSICCICYASQLEITKCDVPL